MTQTSTDIEARLAQVDLLGLITDAFRMPPDAGALAQLDAVELDPLLAATALGETTELREALVQLLEAARITPQAEWSAEYHRLFEGAMACPLNQTAYVRRDKGAILGDLCGFYHAFGWTTAPDFPEKPDHLVCELEFLAMLLTLRAGAAEAAQRQLVDRAMHSFVDAHVGDWLTVLCERLSATTALAFYQHAAAALRALWDQLVRWYDWSVQPSARIDLADEPESPYECIVMPQQSADEAIALTVRGRAPGSD